MNIKPHRFLNLDTCTLKISAEIISFLIKSNNINTYSNLFEKFKKDYKDETDYIFPQALSFLFLLGKIEYKAKNDTVRLIK